MTTWNKELFLTLGGIGCAALTTLHYIYGIGLRWNLKASSIVDTGAERDGRRKVSILSQNMWCVLINGGLNRRKRLQLFIKNIDQDEPDIICLQEMQIFAFGPLLVCGDYIFIQQELLKRGYIWSSDPLRNMPTIGSSSGCVIFSKYPMNQSDGSLYQNAMIQQCKGWTCAHIAVGNEHNILVFNTHLEHKNKEKQYAQIMELQRMIEEKRKEWKATSTLCLGDFNICSNQSRGTNAYRTLKLKMERIGLGTDLYGDTERTYSKSYLRNGTMSLDHLFVDNECKAKVQSTKLVDYRDTKSQQIMSDHLGLLTSFQF